MDKKEKQESKVRNTKKPSNRMQGIFKTLAILKKKYPKAFNRKEPKALKLGILEDIAKDLEGEIGRTKIKKALRYYTNSNDKLDLLTSIPRIILFDIFIFPQ